LCFAVRVFDFTNPSATDLTDEMLISGATRIVFNVKLCKDIVFIQLRGTEAKAQVTIMVSAQGRPVVLMISV